MSKGSIIEFKDVPVFQKGNLVLNNISFTVSRGEFVYIIGRTGTGKTSLLKTIYADLPTRSGSASVAGFDLNKIKDKEIPMLRRKLGIVFQDFQLLTDRNVRDNLLFVMKATGWKDKVSMMERLKQVLKRVGLETKEHKMPHQLSQGEQQRLAIGRALINDPDIILADEPTGNLDPETSSGIMKLLFEIKSAGRAVVMATHDYSLFREFKARTLKCEDGNLIELEDQLN